MEADAIKKYIQNFGDIQFEEVLGADDKLNILYKFDEPWTKGENLSNLVKSFLSIIWENISVIFQTTAPVFLITVGYICLAGHNDHFLQASIGVALTYYKIVHFAWAAAVSDKVAMASAKEYGAKLYQSMINTFYMGMGLQALYFVVVTLPAFIFSRSVMLWISKDESLSSSVHYILLLSLPVAALQSFNMTVRSYITAQGNENLYGKYTLLNILVSSFLAYSFLYQMKLGVEGWILYRIFYEIMNVALNSYLLITNIDKNTIGQADYHLIKHTAPTFVLDTLKASASHYLETLGVESSIFFVSRLKDYTQITAYVSFMNFLRVILHIGDGLMIILRTRVNLLIGKRASVTAENFFWFYYCCLLVVGTILGLITGLSSQWIASLYTNSEQAQAITADMIFLISFVLSMVISLSSVANTMRSLWETQTLTVIYLFMLLFFNAVLGFNLMKRFHMFAYGFSLSNAFSILITNLSAVFKLTTTDWSKVDSKFKEFKKYRELLRRLYLLRERKGVDQGLRFSTNGQPIEILVVNEAQEMKLDPTK